MTGKRTAAVETETRPENISQAERVSETEKKFEAFSEICGEFEGRVSAVAEAFDKICLISNPPTRSAPKQQPKVAANIKRITFMVFSLRNPLLSLLSGKPTTVKARNAVVRTTLRPTIKLHC